MTMSNQRQFVRQTAEVLMAFGLIASLLPGFAAAEDSTFDDHSAWMIDRAGNVPVSPNDRANAAGLIGRLAYNNGNDPDALDAVSKWFATSWTGGEFNYPAIGLLANRYWDKFTQEQRDTLKDSMKNIFDFWSHGTENHAIMRASGGYLLGQLWPDEAVYRIGGQGAKTGAEIMATCKERILSISKSLFYNGYNENLSTTYLPWHVNPWSALYDEADDPEVKAAANAALNFHFAHLASNRFEGLVIPPIARENMQQTSLYAAWQARGYIASAQRYCWLYWGDPDRDINGRWGWSDLPLYLATSSWRPHPAIDNIARQTAPQEIKGSWSHGTYWGGIQPANDPETGYSTPAPFSGLPGEVVRYAYREELFAMGGAFYQYYPGGFYTQNCAFALHYRTSSDKALQTVEVHHPYWRSNTGGWRARNSPFMQIAQHKSTAIVLFNIPNEDPWADRGRDDWQAMRDNHFENLIQEGLLRYPKSIDEMVEANDWIFLREGDVYIAIRPLKDYTIDTDDDSAKTHPNTDQVYFNMVRSAFAQTGFIIDVATSADFDSFAAFQEAISASTPTIDTSQPSASYTNARGDTISATWNPPDYLDTATPVRVRAGLTVNGDEVPVDETYPVLQSPYANVADGLMQLETPEGQLEVDWTGELPAFSNQ